MKKKFAVKALADRKGEVLIYDEIGPSFWGESVDAKTFANEISELDVDELNLRVNSPGGDVFDGIAIMNALKRHPAKVIAYVDGLAASAASVIIAGGADEVVMCEGSQQMIHDAWSWGAGNAEDLSKLSIELDRTSDTLAKIYARRAGTPADEWRDAMREESWFTAEEAVAVGLADRLDAVETADADESIAAFSRSPIMARFKHRGRAAAPTPPIAAKARKETDMALAKELARMLGMTDDNPTDDKIKAALAEALEEQAPEDTTPPASSAAEKVAEAQAALAAAQAASDELQSAANEADKVDDSENKQAEDDAFETVLVNKAVYEDLVERASRGDQAEEETKQERAAALVETEGIKAGRLLGWQRDAWVAKAVDDFSATKAELLKIAPGTIPLKAKGRGGSDEKRLAEADPAPQMEKTADEQHRIPTESAFF